MMLLADRTVVAALNGTLSSQCFFTYYKDLYVLSTALAKNHAKPAKGDTSHVTKMNIFCFSQLIMS